MTLFDEMIKEAEHLNLKHFNLSYGVRGTFKESDYPGYTFTYSKCIDPEKAYLADSPINDEDLFWQDDKMN
jgi:lipid II:glycine glycyltransferase (peptidoglycan interpeptide bridge formation enzyme)